VTNTDFKIVFVVADDYKSSKKEEEKEKLVQEEILHSDDLNKKFLFKNFMVSKSNRVVYNAALAAAASPGNQA
jgi:chromosomal replication initiation ATPase DnaA